MKKLNVMFLRRPKSGHWKYHGETGTYKNGELVACDMRQSQENIYDEDRNTRFVIVNEPPGSGKSTVIKFVHGYDLLANPNRKLIITVPQTLISKSFGPVLLRYPDGKTMRWDISHNLCLDCTESKVNSIIKFIKKRKFVHGIEERILICTHAALAKAYERMSDLSDFRNTTIAIDEMHKLLYAENDEAVMANKLGGMIHDLLNYNDETIKIWGFTATFFRGDRFSILCEDDVAKFKRIYMPFDQHWIENLKDLEDFTYDYIIYNNKPFEDIRSILKHSKVPTIIFCPSENEVLCNGDKSGFVRQLTTEIHKVWPKARILDLVNTSGRSLKKAEIIDEQSAEKIDIILSVDLMNEGVDWRKAQQIIDLSPSHSLRVMGQRFGRLVRHYDGKKHIHYYVFVRFSTNNLDKEERRRNLSENFACFIGSLVLENAIRPIPIKYPKNATPSAKIGQNGSRQYVDFLSEEVPDVGQQEVLLKEVTQSLIALKATKNSLGKRTTKDDIRKCIEECLADNGIKNVADVAIQIVLMWKRAIPKHGEDISWVVGAGFDKIWSNKIFDMIESLGALCGCHTFREMRELYARMSDPISVTHPEVAAMWDWDKNKDLLHEYDTVNT